MNKIRKSRGWKDEGGWYTKDSAYGVKYKCPYCGKETLGMFWGEAEERMHLSSCPKWAEVEKGFSRGGEAA